MLPQIFRTDDVLLEVDFPINDRLPLEKLLASLPADTFTADDSLGWVYQFWQAKKKDEVNKSGDKIDGRTLPAVTQLFTEPYMVQFLLHNTIGAWWGGRQASGARDQGSVQVDRRKQVALPVYEMEYLRFCRMAPLRQAHSRAGPTASKIHHARSVLRQRAFPRRGLQSAGAAADARRRAVSQEACDAVLAENLFGLELDPRCTQIAAFALGPGGMEVSRRDQASHWVIARCRP